MVNQNFTGCIENFYLNATNIIHELKETEIIDENLRYYKIHTIYTCPEPPIIPVTFLTPGSFARLKGYEGVPSMNVSLAFRTYEDRGIILYHQFTTPGFVKVVHIFIFISRVFNAANKYSAIKLIFLICSYTWKRVN